MNASVPVGFWGCQGWVFSWGCWQYVWCHWLLGDLIARCCTVPLADLDTGKIWCMSGWLKKKKLFTCVSSVLPWYSYKSVLMAQQGEGTARVTLEKVNVRDGLSVRQASHLLEFRWHFDHEWYFQVLIQEEKRPHLGHPAPEWSLSVSKAGSQLWITKGFPHTT